MKTKKILFIAMTLLLLISSCGSTSKPATPEQTKQKSAGGIIFYDKGKYADGWRYLEAAPASSEFTVAWGLQDIDCPGTSEGIGSGKANTAIILNLLNKNGEIGKAAQICATLSINGFDDWFIPSKDELNQLYMYAKDTGKTGEFNGVLYWSSSAFSENISFSTWFQSFSDGFQDINYQFGRDDEASIRAVRAF